MHTDDTEGRTERIRDTVGQKGGLREYAREHNYSNHVSVLQWRDAYEVVLKTGNTVTSLSHRVLYEISKSPEAAWQTLCECAQDEGWTVDDTKRRI